jgi:hypothetical protein
MNTTFKTAIAAIISFAALTGAAFAEDTRVVDNGAVLENVYAAMDKTQSKTFELVIAKAEGTIEDRLAQLEPFTASEPKTESFIIASN